MKIVKINENLEMHVRMDKSGRNAAVSRLANYLIIAIRLLSLGTVDVIRNPIRPNKQNDQNQPDTAYAER